MKRYIPAVALLALLAGCSSSGSPSPVAAVTATEASLTAAGKVALAYMQLPVCTGSNGPVCSDPTMKAQIKQAYDAAYAAVTTAQAAADTGSTPDMTAATAALSALQSLVATLPQKSA